MWDPAPFARIERIDVHGVAVEGIENIASKFTQIVQSTKKKPYDILDPRKTDFDKDFIGFTESILNIEDAILDFMDKCFDKVKTSDMAVTLIRRFEKLKLPFLQQYIEENADDIAEQERIDEMEEQAEEEEEDEEE